MVWQSSWQDGYGYGVYAQRYDAGGAPVGGETLINVAAFYDQDQPAVIADDAGGFAVAYASDWADGSYDAIV